MIENYVLSEIDDLRKKAEELLRKGETEESSKIYLKISGLYRILAKNTEDTKLRYLREKRAQQYAEFSEKVKVIKEGSTSSVEKVTREVTHEVREFRDYSTPKVRWSDIGGLEDVKKRLRATIRLFTLRTKLPPYINPPQNLLFYGPPGCGKTLLSKAMANTAEASFLSASASTLLSKYFGESPKLISEFFEHAREIAPTVVFLDELDALGSRRSSETSDAQRRVLTTILEELEGLRENTNILVIGATNKPWDLDEALLSRFDRLIYIPPPDKEARKEIFKIHLKNAKLENITYDELAEKTKRYSGRDIKHIVREVGLKVVIEENKWLFEESVNDIFSKEIKIRPFQKDDFIQAISEMKSLGIEEIKKYEEWGRANWEHS